MTHHRLFSAILIRQLGPVAVLNKTQTQTQTQNLKLTID